MACLAHAALCLPSLTQEFNLKHDEGQDLSKTAIGGMLDGTKSTYDLASTLQTQTRTLFATGTQRVDQTAKQVGCLQLGVGWGAEVSAR